MTPFEKALSKAKPGTVLELPSLLPQVSPEKLIVTVLENVVHEGERRVTTRHHWHGVMLAQKAYTIPTAKEAPHA
ncbi:MAG TPA: hypothetical protein VGD46_02255 [Rhizobacter sp.]